jgi:hypothetical protein
MFRYGLYLYAQCHDFQADAIAEMFGDDWRTKYAYTPPHGLRDLGAYKLYNRRSFIGYALEPPPLTKEEKKEMQ